MITNQKGRYENAKKKYESRMKTIETKIDVNAKRQAEVLKQLKMLKEEETRLQTNRVFETEVQNRASEVCLNIECVLMKGICCPS